MQGGDCAETLADCRSHVIADKLKILLQMSLVMIHEGKRPVIRVGRFAGQYAKPRSNPVEIARGRRAAQLLRRHGQPGGLHRGRAAARPENMHRRLQPRGDDAQLHPLALRGRLRRRAPPRVLGARRSSSAPRPGHAARGVRADDPAARARRCASWRRSERRASKS